VAGLKHYKPNGAQTPTDKLRSTKVSEFSGAKVKSLVMPVYIGSDDQNSPNDFIDAASDVITTMNNAMMPQGGQLWPSSIGVCGITISASDVTVIRVSELYNNATLTLTAGVEDSFKGSLLIHDMQLYVASGAPTVSVSLFATHGGDGVEQGAGFSGDAWYFLTAAQAVTNKATSVFNHGQAGSGVPPIPMGQYTSLLFTESAGVDCTAFVLYGVTSYGGGTA